MKFSNLQAIIAELGPVLSGGRVERVFENEEGDLILTVRNVRQDHLLLISMDRSLPRLHLVTRKQHASGSQRPFVLFLKSRVAGGRIAAITLLNDDRIVIIRFLRQNREIDLIIELFGSHCNMAVVLSGQIQAIYRTVSPGTGRMLRVGEPYLPPVRTIQTGPVSREAAHEQESLGALNANRSAEVSSEKLRETMHLAAEKKRLQSIMHTRLKRSERRLQAIEKDHAESAHADTMRKAGDLILANMNRISRHATEVELNDPDGTSVVLQLDPRRTPAANADSYFKRYKKARAGKDIRETRLRETEEECIFLRSMLEKLEQTQNADELSGIEAMLRDKGYVRAGRSTDHRKQQDGPETASFRLIRYRGWEIIVGKSAAGNDHLSTRLAAPDDLWLHAEGLPGSHVLVRNPGKREIDEDVLLKAASLAAFYSKGRSAGKVAVTYTLARYVKKPRGAKPGLVALERRRTIMAVPEHE